MIKFKPIDLEDKKLFDEYIARFQPKTSEISFTNLYIWRHTYQFEYAESHGFLWVKGNKPGEEMFFLPPIGGKEEDMEKSISSVMEYTKGQEAPVHIVRADKKMVERLKNFSNQGFHAEPQREHFDYVYLQKDLAALEGRKYSRKRNHINQFLKEEKEWDYRPLTAQWIEGCCRLQREWCDAKACHENHDLLCEQKAVFEALEHFDQLDYKGGVILVEGEVEAFAFGEMLNSDTAVIHIEKVGFFHHGLYTLINQQFSEKAWSNAKYVNREQDLGIPGIRKAKESYYPVEMVEKYMIRF